MCRYAEKRYKPHLACFACRKSFKRRLAGDLRHQGASLPARCPQCRGLLANMGLDFKPPKQTDTRAWAALASLFEAGETFHSCGCNGPGYRPRDPRLLAAYFADRHLELSERLAQWFADTDAPRRAEAIENLKNQLARLEAAQRRLRPSSASPSRRAAH